MKTVNHLMKSKKTENKHLSTSGLFGFLMALCMLFSIFSINGSDTVFAATSGGCNSSTITVTTNPWKLSIPSEESITLTQSPITCHACYGTTTKSGYYGRYKITVYNSNGSVYKTYSWNGGKTYTVKLYKAGTTFRIKVEYQMSTLDHIPLGYYMNSNPYWYVSSTNKIASYY